MNWANLHSLWPPSRIGFWLLLSVLAAVVGFVLIFHWRRRVLESLGHLPQIMRMSGSVSGPRRITKAVLVILGLLFAVVAWIRPYSEGKPEKVKRVGLDMVLVIDFSKSMYVRDIPRSRIDKAKQELDRFLEGLEGDRVGVVAFAGSVKEFPLTTDYNAARLFYQQLTPNDMPVGGTAIGKAVIAAVRMLQRVRKPDDKRAQVVILLTDGEDHESDPLEAARMAKKLDIKIYALGIGSPSGDMVPMILDDGTEGGRMKKSDSTTVVSRLDEKTLLKMVDTTGGRYFRATAASFGMGKIIKAMKDLKRSAVKASVVRRHVEQYHFFLLPAILLLLMELCLGDRRLASGPGSQPQQAAEGEGAPPAPDPASERPGMPGHG